LRIGVGRRGLVKASHVATNARNSQEAGMAIDRKRSVCTVTIGA
jgi:hypothetical protein